jgi:hypothetical protein
VVFVCFGELAPPLIGVAPVTVQFFMNIHVFSGKFQEHQEQG